MEAQLNVKAGLRLLLFRRLSGRDAAVQPPRKGLRRLLKRSSRKPARVVKTN